jgi:hypothetical protein
MEFHNSYVTLKFAFSYSGIQQILCFGHVCEGRGIDFECFSIGLLYFSFSLYYLLDVNIIQFSFITYLND